VVSAAFRFAGLVAAMNNGQEVNVPILKVIALLVGSPETNSMRLAGTGLLGRAIQPNRAGALF
jgi:hypothetical protein